MAALAKYHLDHDGGLTAGGSANVPSELYISPHTWRAPAGDRLKLNVQVKTTGTVSGIIYVNPLR